MALRYGHKIRLAAASAYASSATGATDPRAVGYYEKHGRHGVLSCVPPLGKEQDGLFTEEEFLVLDPSGKKQLGDEVMYGHALVLVDQHGMVWNNKTGGITGYVGPRARNIPGEMYVSFRRGGASLSGKTTASRSASSSSVATEGSTRSRAGSASFAGDAGAQEEGVVMFGDSNVAIAIVESNRHSQKFNKRLTNFKKPTSKILGGYICCDGKGAELRFAIWPAMPRIEQISMMNKLITAYSYGQKIALPVGLLESTAALAGSKADANSAKEKNASAQGLQRAEIFFRLSNQATAVLPGKLLQQKLTAHAANVSDDEALGAERESVFVLPIRTGPPGELIVKLTGVASSTKVGKLTGDSSIAKQASKKAVPAQRSSLSALLQAARVLRRIPMPIFALIYALIMHFSWGALSTLTSGLQRELVVLVLVMLPLFYIAVKVEHPFSSLFDPPTTVLGMDEFSAGHPAEDAEDSLESGTLKLIVTEYRFTPPAATTTAIANGSGISSNVAGTTTSKEVEVPPASTTTMLESTGQVPTRFINAEKGDEEKAHIRYDETTEWRREEGVDMILQEPSPHFRTIKANYPHYYHKRGKNNEPVYYEKPGKINLKALKAAGLTLDDLMHNYLMITEFLWQVIEPDDNKKCISILDVEGIGISDFAGEAVEYVRKAAGVSGKHYPERCAYIFVINVPSWFNMIWNTVKGMVDEVTREKVIIVRGKKKILEALAEKIPLESIPAEYGGQSDGKSPEEDLLFNLMAYLNKEDGAPTSNPIASHLRNKPIKH